MELIAFFAVLGGFLEILGLLKLFAYKIKLKKFIRVDGCIEDFVIEKRHSSEGTYTLYKSYITYIVDDQKFALKTKKAKLTQSKAEALKNTIVDVYYDPNDPNRAIVKGDCEAIPLIIIGALFLFLPIAFLYYRIKGEV